MADADGVLAAIDSALDDYAVSDDAMRWAPDKPRLTLPSLEPPTAAFTAFADAMRGAAEQAAQSFAKVLSPALAGLQNAFHKRTYQGDRRHYRRCSTCNPRGFPKPLPINGREYNRRRRRRNRR